MQLPWSILTEMQNSLISFQCCSYSWELCLEELFRYRWRAEKPWRRSNRCSRSEKTWTSITSALFSLERSWTTARHWSPTTWREMKLWKCFSRLLEEWSSPPWLLWPRSTTARRWCAESATLVFPFVLTTAVRRSADTATICAPRRSWSNWLNVYHRFFLFTPTNHSRTNLYYYCSLPFPFLP